MPVFLDRPRTALAQAAARGAWSRGAAVALLAAALAAAGCGGGAEAPEGTAAGEAAASTLGEPSPVRALPAADVEVDNVLLVTIDTLRADALGFAGNPRAETPTLDRMAAGGRVYRRAHAHNVVTLPSHANILTGRHPYEHGVRDNLGFALPESVPTAATLLSEAGFATAAVVGAFPLDARFGLDRGFDLYDDHYPEGSAAAEFVPPERRGDEVVEIALDWWREHAGERRFLWVHLFDPHAPYLPPEPFASRFAEEPYLGEVAAVDAYLEPLLSPFFAGEEEPTLVVFTSDHGEALGEHGELTHGLFAYEPTLRVPLVLWAPGLPPGASREPARHVDLLPTILDAVGETGAAPEGLPGRSLLAGESAGAPAAERETYFEVLGPALTRGWAPLTGIVHRGEKYIDLPLPELYDLDHDPDEEENLVDSERRRLRELAARLPEASRWPPRQTARRELSDEEEAALGSLGYAGGRSGGSLDREFTAADDPKNLVGVDRDVHRLIDLYQGGRLAEAAEVGRRVVAAQPRMGVGYYYLAQVLLEADRPGEAVAVMRRGVEAGTTYPPLDRQLGLSLAQLGRAGEAVEILARLAREQPDAETLNAYGLVLSEAGRQGEAEAALGRVLELDPKNPTARQHLALVALRREEWTTARRQAERALAGNDRLSYAWSYLGAALYNLGERRRGLEAWERAVALDDGNFDALFNVSLAAAALGERERARAALERFVAEAPVERYARDVEAARVRLRQLGG